MHHIAQGRADLEPLRVYYAWNSGAWQRDAMRMTFVSNHDMNAWEGTEFEQFGDALEAAIVLSVVGEGIPLIYSGQEAGSDRRLLFFDKDVIDWREHELGRLYSRLFALKKQHRALWNGAWGAPMVRVPNSAESAVLSFVRRHPADAPRGEAVDSVFAAFNLSPDEQTVQFGEAPYDGNYIDERTGETSELRAGTELVLPAWAHVLLTTWTTGRSSEQSAHTDRRRADANARQGRRPAGDGPDASADSRGEPPDRRLGATSATVPLLSG
jgi:hypothetical protein